MLRNAFARNNFRRTYIAPRAIEATPPTIPSITEELGAKLASTVTGARTIIEEVGFVEFSPPVYLLNTKNTEEGFASRETLVPIGT
jgi:hypothetical protein